VWHQHEVTYCAVFPATLLPAGATSVIGAYNWLSGGLLRGLQELGVCAELSSGRQNPAQSTSDVGRARPDNCFLAAAQCDTVVDGRKLIGAAQCRKTVGESTLILQHGSLLLDIDDSAWRRALGEGTNDTMEQMVSLRALGLQVSREHVMAALVQGMQTVLDVQWERDEPGGHEVDVADRLHREKYTQVSWNRVAHDGERLWRPAASN
jgi:lipoate-protein ligase A